MLNQPGDKSIVRATSPDFIETTKTLQAYQAAINEVAIVSVTDLPGKIIYVNEKFSEISRYSPEELIGNTHRLINSGQHPSDFFKDMWQTIKAGNPWRGEIKNRAKDGSFYWVDTVITPVKDENDSVNQYLSIRNLITIQKQLAPNVVRPLILMFNPSAPGSPVWTTFTPASRPCSICATFATGLLTSSSLLIETTDPVSKAKYWTA